MLICNVFSINTIFLYIIITTFRGSRNAQLTGINYGFFELIFSFIKIVFSSVRKVTELSANQNYYGSCIGKSHAGFGCHADLDFSPPPPNPSICYRFLKNNHQNQSGFRSTFVNMVTACRLPVLMGFGFGFSQVPAHLVFFKKLNIC